MSNQDDTRVLRESREHWIKGIEKYTKMSEDDPYFLPFIEWNEQNKIFYDAWIWLAENGHDDPPLLVSHYGSCNEDGSCGCPENDERVNKYIRECGYEGELPHWVFIPGQR